MNERIKALSKEMVKEAIGHIPGGDFAVIFSEFILEHLVKAEQLQAAINWVQETKAHGLKIEDGQPTMDDIKKQLEQIFESTPPEDRAFVHGYATSMISNHKLIQYFINEESREHLSPSEGMLS